MDFKQKSIIESLNSVPVLIGKTFPIPRKFRGALPSDIMELSRLLTNSRGERKLSYLSQPKYLSAYLHYFLPWNLYRLCLLLPSLNLSLKAGDKITDLGCGPLTFASALWISYPALRKIPLEINCVDRVQPVMEAGKDFFTQLALNTNKDGNIPWKINLIKKDINILKEKPGNSAKTDCSFLSAINLFNEMHDRISHNDINGLRKTASNAANFMHGKAAKETPILIVEPGVPQSGKFISLLRNSFIELGRNIISPCTHIEACPLTPKYQGGVKQRWCHCALETPDVPKELNRLSAAAKLPKERLTFSYLLTGNKNEQPFNPVSSNQDSPNLESSKNVRIISDAFPLPDNQYGRYGCSSLGLVLLKGQKTRIEKLNPLYIAETGKLNDNKDAFDAKSGAKIMELI